MYYGDIALGQTIDFQFTTRKFTTGAPFTLAGTPSVAAYVGNGTTEITAGITLDVDFDGRTGLNHVRVVATSGNGFATATDVAMVITAGTVDSVSVVGERIASFSIENRSALRPATSGRTVVVDANGLVDANTVKLGPTGSGTAQTARDIGASVLLTASETSIVRANTAQAGTSTTLTLDASASAVDGYYTGASLLWTSGANNGVVRTITGYVGSTKVATFAVALPTTADATPTFAIKATRYALPGVDGKALISTDSQDLSATLSVNAKNIGGTAQTGRDIGASVLLSNGTGAGQLKLASGYVAMTWADIAAPTTTVNLSGTTVKAVTDRVSANTDQLAGQTVTAAAGVTFPSSVASPTNITAGTITTVTNLTNAPTNGDLTTAMKTSVANAAWDEAISGHLGAGTTGAALNAAGSAGDPWSTPLPGAYGAGTAGKIIGDNINATISSRSTLDAAGVRTAVGLASANLDTQLDALPTAAENATAIWGAGTRVLTAGTNIVLAKGTGVTGFNDLSAAQVNAEADTALSDVGVTTTVTGRIDAAISTRLATVGYTAPPTAAANADAVWDEALAGHVGAGSAGAALTAAGGGSDPAAIAAAVWDEPIADHLDAGSTGNALNNATAGGNPWEAVVEGAFTGGDLLRVCAGYAAGKTDIVKTGANAATVTFRNITDTGDIIVGDAVDSERVAVTVTP